MPSEEYYALRELLKKIESFLVRKVSQVFYFHEEALDANIWLAGGDAGGSFTRHTFLISEPPAYYFATGGGLNDDYYAHKQIRGFAVSPWQTGYSKVVWGCRFRLDSTTNEAAFLGLIRSAITNYAEPVDRCAHFFVDTSIGNNIYARSYEAAEEQTDTGIVIDTNWHTLRIEWTRIAVKFYIDGALVAAHTTQVPTIALISEYLLRGLAVAARFLFLEYDLVETLRNP